jgi:hypothetical protein
VNFADACDEVDAVERDGAPESAGDGFGFEQAR